MEKVWYNINNFIQQNTRMATWGSTPREGNLLPKQTEVGIISIYETPYSKQPPLT